ncbi:MAG TPA: PRD domain-containing protein [Candidatus Dorea intestinavium]|nr:PRD domain-containing protein [Candidatus Dorea intestinavium]
MIIEKVINNNVVSAFDHKDREVIIMGRGIGFKKRPGEKVPEDKIEKKFVLNNEDEVGRFTELLKSLPLEHLQASSDIIDYAKQVMKGQLNQNIYITLTDHINFAIERQKGGMLFRNALLQEVRSFYPSEYLIGEYAIALIDRQIGIKFPVDEAASIALHFVNAEYNTGMSDTMKITSLIQEVLNIVEEEFQINLNEAGLHYSRFVTHLKFLAQRIFTKQMLDNHEQEFIDMIVKIYPREFECSQKIGNYIKEQYGHSISKEELAYLTVHIRRVQPEIND